MKTNDHVRLSVAPMMDCTDRHCRYFHRLFSKQVLLYTEMVTSSALVKGGALHLLTFNDEEHPVAFQLGGSDPEELAEAAQIVVEAGYDEINLNVGCPSSRVKSGHFGAILMKRPQVVEESIKAIRKRVDIDVTVKCRIGIDNQNPEHILPDLLERLECVGCQRVIIHARKALLNGLSPKENREIPPLQYDLVYKMKEQFPDFSISLNGGVTSLDQAKSLIDAGIDGVMIGRAAYDQPVNILSQADRCIFGVGVDTNPIEVAHKMIPYIDKHVKVGGSLHQITRHMMGLFWGQSGAKDWRRALSEDAMRDSATSEVIEVALERFQNAEHRCAAE